MERKKPRFCAGDISVLVDPKKVSCLGFSLVEFCHSRDDSSRWSRYHWTVDISSATRKFEGRFRSADNDNGSTSDGLLAVNKFLEENELYLAHFRYLEGDYQGDLYRKR